MKIPRLVKPVVELLLSPTNPNGEEANAASAAAAAKNNFFLVYPLN